MAPDQKDLARRVAAAGAWTVGARLSAKLIDLAMLFCLARFLGPADFGLVAMAMAVVFVVEALLDLPTSVALLRGPSVTRAMLNTAFTLGLLRGFAIGVLLLALAWPLAWFNNEPRLAVLLSVLALAPAARGMSSPRMVEYARAFNFQPDAVVELSGKVLAFVVSVALAAATGSYWAIAAATICSPVLGTLASYVVAPFRPRLSLSEWHRFSNFLGWNFVAQFCSALNWQIDRLLLSRLTPIAAFGQYSIAKQISEIPIQALAVPLLRPAMTALASAGPTAGARYVQLSRAMLVVMVPAMTVPVLWPEALIRVALGPNWLSAAQWLQWISAASLLGMPALLMGALTQMLDRTHWLARRTVIDLLIRVPLVWWGAAHHGIPGVIAASAVSSLATTAVSFLIVRHLSGASVRAQLGMLRIPFIAVLPAGALLWATQPAVSGAANVFGLVALGLPIFLLYLLVYGLCVWIVWRWTGRPAGFEQHAFETAAAWLARYRRHRAAPGESPAASGPGR
ncbi:oligosaccharide flippase family protein [Xenophilus azovorans]|uniref:oligosaccharide flippase family protein n=1 Tax=Xenophilus azovorans TaxID=151755 RepID=UPI00068DF4F3|nr:oligosaccharide flippase family protein [Xenophilus azovorans]